MSSKQQTNGVQFTGLSHFRVDIDLPFKVVQSASSKSSKYDRDGHWNEKERLKYAIFLSYFRQLFDDPLKKKTIRIYDMMSDMIITRNSNQCRSHHQKMEKYRNTIPEIISSVAEKYEPRVYRELEDKYLVLVKNILENKEKYTRPSAMQERPRNSHPSAPSRPEVRRFTLENVIQPQVVEPKKDLQVETVVTVTKDKEREIKTADSYLEEKIIDSEDQNDDQVPMMTIHDPKIEGDSENMMHKQSSENICQGFQVFTETGLFSFDQSLQLTFEGKSYYGQQIKMLQMRRQWHVNNVQQLSSQLMSEKQSIKHCEASIQLYQLALNAPI